MDSDHAYGRDTRISQTGVLVFVNKAPIIWYINLQKNVETSMFSSEFIALKKATKLTKYLGYNLQVFGIPIEVHPTCYVTMNLCTRMC